MPSRTRIAASLLNALPQCGHSHMRPCGAAGITAPGPVASGPELGGLGDASCSLSSSCSSSRRCCPHCGDLIAVFCCCQCSVLPAVVMLEGHVSCVLVMLSLCLCLCLCLCVVVSLSLGQTAPWPYGHAHSLAQRSVVFSSVYALCFPLMPLCRCAFQVARPVATLRCLGSTLFFTNACHGPSVIMGPSLPYTTY